MGKLRKGLGTSTVLILIGALLFAGFIGVLMTESPLADAILQGAGLADKKTDYTIDIEGETEEEARNTLSDLSMLVWQRASNNGCAGEDSSGSCNADISVCGQIAGGISNPDKGESRAGYPYLEDTYLTSTPTCAGTGSTIARGLTEDGPIQTRDSGQDMEGVFSRERFEIPPKDKGGHKIVLGEGNTWLDRNFLAASKLSFRESVVENDDCDLDLLGSVLNFLVGGAFGLGPEPAEADQYGTGYYYTVFFADNDVDNDRFSHEWMDSKLQDDGDHIVYCTKGPNDFWNTVDWAHAVKSPVHEKYGGKDTRLTLCPGDKGYIQMNKEKPREFGEASESVSGNDRYYMFMQITETGDCSSSGVSPGGGGGSGSSLDLSSYWDGDPNYNNWPDDTFTDDSGDLVWTPDDTSGRDIVRWDLDPEQQMTFTVEFQDRGHFRLDATNWLGRLTNINTDATGAEDLWLYYFDCDSSDWPGDPGSDCYGDSGWDYDLNEEYEMQYWQSSENAGWYITQGGSEEYSVTFDIGGGSGRAPADTIEMEAWEKTPSGVTTDDAEVKIKDVERTDYTGPVDGPS